MAHPLDRKVLLLCKKSAYSIYSSKGHPRAVIARYKKAHDEHSRTLATIERILHKYEIKYAKCVRGRKIAYQRYGLVIAVGGDGTFLEAARNVNNQVLLGVNSAPGSSVGKLCVATQKNFEEIIRRVIAGKDFRFDSWHRLRLKVAGLSRPIDHLNDVLICHQNPAAVSRYYLQIGNIREEQRGSGLWVAAAAGRYLTPARMSCALVTSGRVGGLLPLGKDGPIGTNPSSDSCVLGCAPSGTKPSSSAITESCRTSRG